MGLAERPVSACLLPVWGIDGRPKEREDARARDAIESEHERVEPAIPVICRSVQRRVESRSWR